MLVRPGSSLGGARPKAVIADRKNIHWIAKFPSAGDERNMGAWEKVMNDIAAAERFCKEIEEMLK